MKDKKLKIKVGTKNFYKFLIISIGLFLLIAYFSLLITTVYAASPQFLVSWQAQSYTPEWYSGKIFPAKGAPVEVNFELVQNGTVLNLSRTKIRWYINDELVKNEDNGLGIQSLSFNTPDYKGNETEVRIAIPEYRTGELNQVIRIPVLGPELVISSPRPEPQVAIGDNSFTALPFFFNAKSLDNLNFSWSANGETPQSVGDNPWVFNLNIDSRAASGFAVNLKATVQNFLNDLEFASRDMRLEVR